MNINLDKYLITKKSKPLLIAELSCNHCGSLNLAKKIIKEAKKQGADFVKFQTYEPGTMTLKSKKEDVIRHGEAVGIGMLCEIYYIEGKSKNFDLLKSLLLKYELPTNINKFIGVKNKRNISNQIFKNIFLDKKRINKFPRIIKIIKIGKSKIIEMKNNTRIKQTINKVII